jgi:hypothetical protein
MVTEQNSTRAIQECYQRLAAVCVAFRDSDGLIALPILRALPCRRTVAP